MADLELWASDRRFGLKIPDAVVQHMLKQCQRAYPFETGGIFVGYYSDTCDCAVVTAASKAPRDSRSGRTWFERGVQGMQRWLDRLWQKHRHYYLGEWHFHPGAAPQPSPTDRDQMQRIAASHQYHCPEPVLLIIGGNPPHHWTSAAYVFVRHARPISLLALSTHEETRAHCTSLPDS